VVTGSEETIKFEIFEFENPTFSTESAGSDPSKQNNECPVQSVDGQTILMSAPTEGEYN